MQGNINIEKILNILIGISMEFLKHFIPITNFLGHDWK
jgi:hypothetical protein